ncbi:hypothetical protein Tco_1540436 [Tanacetum coccineum]
MRTCSQTPNRNRQQQSQPAVVQTFHLEEPFVNPPLVPMADNRKMAQLLQAPTEGYEDAIVIPEINANFEFGFDQSCSKQRFQQRFDESFYEAWDRFNDLLRACPHHGFSELHQLDTFYNALNANDQDSLNSAAGGNFLDKMPRECLRIIETTDGDVYQDNIQEYVSQAAAANFNQGNINSRPPMVSNQIRPPGFPPIQNNENRFNPNQGNNFNQNRGTNFNQNRGSNFNQGQVYQPPTNQPPVYQAPPQQMQGVSKTDFENYVKANDAVL